MKRLMRAITCTASCPSAFVLCFHAYHVANDMNRLELNAKGFENRRKMKQAAEKWTATKSTVPMIPRVPVHVA